MSLLDLAAEIFGANLTTAWLERMESIGDHTGENNTGYLRELRNAVVHRGLDIASSGTVVSNHVRAIAPAEISDRFGRRGSFKAFASTLFEVFEIGRSIAGPLVLEFAEPSFRAIEAMDLDEIRADYLRDMEASTLMPEWAKKMARESVDQIPFAEIRLLHSNKLRTLLS